MGKIDRRLARRLDRRLDRRQFLKLGVGAGVAAWLAGCSLRPTAPLADLLSGGNSIPMDQLIAAAKQEGSLTTIALPHDWANYGKMLSAFKSKYDLRVNELDPGAGSGEELQAIRQGQTDSQFQAPDVLDIGMGFTEPAKSEGLLSQYKTAVWNTVPENVKDPEGYWCGNYYGVLAFEVNLSLVKTVPQDWPDLLKPEYKGMIALAGDPTVSNQAVYSVWAAGFSKTGSLDDAPVAGLEFFAELHKAGNFLPGSYDQAGKFNPLIADLDTIRSGQTPIVIRWDFLCLSNRDTLRGEPDEAVVVPKTGILAGSYAHAISAYAASPFAARLWAEFIFSDEGQLIWLEGYVHPVRYNDLVKRHKIPAELAAKLPPAENYAKAAFPTLTQITSATQVITKNWRRIVLGE